MNLVIATMLFASLTAGPESRLDEAATVFSEIMAAPDKGIPQDLIEQAHCVVIVPSLKTAALGVGAKYGKGFLTCRKKSGPGWTAPGSVRIEGGSVGFQIGGSSTDLIMLVMSEQGAKKLLESLEALSDEENERLWAEEADRRDGAWDSVPGSGRSAADVLRDARAKLK